MYATYYHVTLALFFATPPALLIIRIFKPKRMPWWLLIFLAAFLGWVMANLAAHFYFDHLDELLEQAGGVEHAPQDLVDRWQHDGPALSVALLFGWLYGLAYLTPWMIVYGAQHAVRASRLRGMPSNQRLERP